MTMPIFSPPVSSTFDDDQPRLSSGARLVSAAGQALPLERTRLCCEAGGGIARSVLRQRFRNDGREPLEVTYLLPLPSDGAVSGYSFELGGVITRGTIEPTQLARERYEEALIEGRSAALLEQERSSVFRQLIGNVPAGQHIDLEVSVDHPLAWIGGGWELRFPTVVAPRYQAGAQEQASSTVPITLDAVSATHEVSVSILDELRGAPRSPSHALESHGPRAEITSARLDRDVVVRWDVARPELGVRLETASTGPGRRLGLLTLVPPDTAPRAMPRDLIVLLDTSGSMAGEPLAQAVRLVSALVTSLTDQDRLELIEFGTEPRRWKAGAVTASAEHRRDALAWLSGLRAGGGTEMRSGILAALASLRAGALRQVVLVSDGLIGFEREVLRQLWRDLPVSCRFHTVGVGHGTNQSLLMPAARAGRGACIIITPNEDVEPACARLLARTAAPLVVSLELSGPALAAPVSRPLDLYAGYPALVPLALRPEGGSLEIRGETPDGVFVEQLRVEPGAEGSGHARVAALYGRERIEDLELSLATGSADAKTTEQEIERLGVEFQIASRLTSWVAVSEQINVDGTRSSRRVEQPQSLPAGMSAEGFGLRTTLSAVGGGMLTRARLPPPAAMAMRPMSPPMAAAPAALPKAPKAPPSMLGRVRQFFTPRAPRRVQGKLRLHKADKLSISFELDGDVEWRLPERVTLQLADGARLELEPSLPHSTGRALAGQSVRLVFVLSSALPAELRSLSFEVDAEAWTVEVTI